MFAVSGWSVTAPLKKQVDSNVNARPAQKSVDPAVKVEPQKPQKPQTPQKDNKDLKRKRQGGPNVTDDNVSSMWEQHFEGKKPDSRKVKKQKKQKDRELNKAETTTITSPKSGQQSISKEETPQSTGASTVDVSKPAKKDKKKQKKQKKTQDEATSSHGGTIEPTKSTNKSTIKQSSAPPAPEPKLTPLQASMRAKLSSARFRHLNEQLYTTPSRASLDLFTTSPTLFSEYHTGFRQQVAVWPENPVDTYISELRVRGAVRRAPNPNSAEAGSSIPILKMPLPRTKGTCTVADLGCGDARLSADLQKFKRKLNLEILSFDLHSPSPLVTAADVAALPLPEGAVDISIFCLALMGTNWPDFIDEAWRVLRWRGELWVAEIKSRFARPSGKPGNSKDGGSGGSFIGKKRKADESAHKHNNDDDHDNDVTTAEIEGERSGRPSTDVGAFVAALKARGFVLAGSDQESIDLSNKMFVRMRFVKATKPERGKNVGADSGNPRDRFARPEGTDMMNRKKKKFLDRPEEEVDPVQEAKILKPCVYKLR